MQSPTKATSPLLLLIGAGPGIGRALATSFASGGHFTRILLCSRSARHLEEEKAAVESAIAASSSAEAVEVGTLALDLGDLDALPGKLAEVEREWLSGEKGGLGCVWHNAASIRFGEPLGAGVGEVEADVKTAALALYTIAQWALPHLLASASASASSPPAPPPSLLATSSHLPEHPHPALLPLSMAKAAQQMLLLGLHEAFGEKVRIGVLKVAAPVSAEAGVLNPGEIGRRGVQFWGEGFAGGVTRVLSEEEKA